MSSLHERTTRWFERAKASLLDTLPCAQGCSDCCVGLFSVTILDRQEIQRGLTTLPGDRRKRILEAAEAQVTVLTSVVPILKRNFFIDQWPEEDIDRLSERFAAWPCPALEQDGSCGLYECRPLVCRSMGIPVDDGTSVSGACAVQTAVPLIRLSHALREEEDRLARLEAEQLEALCHQQGAEGEEVLLPFAFLPDSLLDRGGEST